ncbi:exopolysaccharide biosynthesis protein, WecB/TagA/CpsF family [Thiovulum sp. ES]|nr:exopolysaccharide biosynthesis protein, WecB/TagA/CpsF family [Thiovulum sp. ES]
MRINIFNCPIDTFTMAETIEKIDKSIQNRNHLHHVVVNAAKLINMQKDIELYNSVVNADIINPDGQAVVWASRILKQPLPERVAGIDIMQNIVKLAFEKGYRIFFLGAKEEIVKGVVERYSKEFSSEIVAGYRNGYFGKEEESVAREIAESRADILFVAISSPTKEIFLEKYKEIIDAPFIMGVGGSFDVVSGKVKRAPLWMQKSGLEWFFRFLQEPRRMWRRAFITNGKFILLVLKEYLKNKK